MTTVADCVYSSGSNRRLIRYSLPILLATVISACGSSPNTEQAGQPANQEELIAGMHIVDCLLPGQVRSLGNQTYITARRPIKTTASDCNIRGGEYVAYDRADYKSALNVWMPAAKAGDADAQVNVGEIFEKGLGTEPNYQAAAIWYEKSAAQGNERALFNLGTLYEQGLGVPANKLKALNLYRQAWGLPEDNVIFQTTARKEQEQLRAALAEEIAAKDTQVRLLQKQISSLQEKLKAAAKARPASAGSTSADHDLRAEMESLQQLVTSLQQSRTQVQTQLAALPATSGPKLRAPTARTPLEAVETRATTSNAVTPTMIGDLNFGKYYALIIGNRQYRSLSSLDTPWNDARELATILETMYGFQVELLLDADRFSIMNSINALHDKLGENDNLLIYYAGHGNLVDIGERNTGYWLPVNADPPPNDSFWVSNEFITNHLGRIEAKRVLVVADSCYGGLLSSSPGHLFFGTGAQNNKLDYIRYKLPRRSRLLLSSGGDKPVIDAGGEGHSVFARELINALKSNTQVLSAPDLFTTIKEPVTRRALANNFAQEPVYKSIKGAGHEVGDFFFVPRANN
ncbi:MAG: peptidase C14 [Spongiibacteraceae bacterium]|nr:peptidase C14 [Spongiibacteraceae bacterium]